MRKSVHTFTALIAAAVILITGVFGPPEASAQSGLLRYVRVPILMYHYIRVNPNPHDLVGADLSVSPQRFLQEMQILAARGYHTITLDDLRAAVTEGAPLPSRPIILTFDDGYEDFYTAAFPIISEFGFKATSFVITGKVGWSGYLTWDQMRSIQASGLVQFESQTVNHLALSALGKFRLLGELADSKAAIEIELGRPVRYIAYPSGRYNWATLVLAREVGYLAGVTTHYGAVHSSADLLTLTRVRVHGGESPATFAASVVANR